MVLFAISSKLIFNHFILHTLLFIIPSSFRSYFTSITLITTHFCFLFLFASMFSIHSFLSIPIAFFLLPNSITLSLIHFHSSPLIPFHFIIPIHFLSLFWLHILSRSVVLCNFVIHRFHSFHPILSSFLFSIHIVSSLLLFVSQLWDPIHVCSVTCYLIIICCVDRKHYQSIDVIAFVSDDWFERSRIEWWGNGRMGTCGVEWIGPEEAVIIEDNSTRR